VWDGIGTLCIGVLLSAIAVVLAVEMKSLLIGESADVHVQGAIEAAIASAPKVEQLIHLRTQHLGPEEVLVAAKIAFAQDLTVPELAAAVDAVERDIRAAAPLARYIYVEPDIVRPAGDPTEPDPAEADPAESDEAIR
jgi:divalent metal cation (Fe/Co/Zn/Cd) transporter